MPLRGPHGAAEQGKAGIRSQFQFLLGMQAPCRKLMSKGQGGRARLPTGHSLRTLTVPQPSTTQAPEMVAWQPTPHPSHASAGPKNKMLPAITMAVRTLRMVYLFDRTNTQVPV